MQNPIVDSKTLYVAISQSGETADTLAALREIKLKGGLVAGVTNVVGSSLARETDFGTYVHAGPEISVCSTKAFTAQVLATELLALQFARMRDLSATDGRAWVKAIEQLPELVDPTQSCRHVRRQRHSTRQEKPRRRFGGVVEDGVRSVLPLAFEVEVCTRGDQHLEHRRVFRGDVRGTLTERERRRVDMFLDMRHPEEPPDCGDFTARHRIAERLDVALLQMLNEHRPRIETGVARDCELRVRELKRARGASVRANGFQSSTSGGIALM